MNIGDKISVLDEAIDGVVTAINGDMVEVLTEDGFEIDFEKSELIVIERPLSKSEMTPGNVHHILLENQERKPKNNKRVKPKERTLPPMEVDLHIHHLVQHTKGLSNYEMLNIQLDTAKRQLDFAIHKKIQRVVFIHGVGEGVLRAELESLFRRYENMQYNDANFKKYGRGATEVYIFQNKNP